MAYNLQIYGSGVARIIGQMQFLFVQAYIIILVTWEVAHKNDPENIKPINWWLSSNFLIIMICRVVIMSVKYGQFSNLHHEVLGKCQLSDEALAKFLIFNTLSSNEFLFEKQKIQIEMRKLRLDENEFKIKVYKP